MSGEVIRYSVSEGEAGERLDAFIVRRNSGYSRAFWQNLIKSGNVLICEAEMRKCSYNLRVGDEIAVCLQSDGADRSTDAIADGGAENGDDESALHEKIHDEFREILKCSNSKVSGEKKYVDIRIVYEDEYLAVINKEAGITVHPGAGTDDMTLVHGLVSRYGEGLSHQDTVRPGIVHRLDRWTSGLMLIAKDDITHNMLGDMIKKREVARFYRCAVWGVPKLREDTINAPIGRSKYDRVKMAVKHGGKEATTHYKVIRSLKNAVTLVECKLSTGRTHQIRVHMKHIGHPIIGDAVYCGRLKHSLQIFNNEERVAITNMSHQALHAYKISFLHPRTKVSHEYEIEAEGPTSELFKIFGIAY